MPGEIFLNPEVDVTVGALAIALATLLGYAVAFGLISIVNAFLHAFFHFAEDVAGFTIGWFPGVGKWVKGKIEAAEQKATGRLGDAARGLEGRVADAFHAGADQARSLGNEIQGQAIAIWRLAWWMHNVVKPWLIHNTIGQLQRHDKTQTARARTNAADLAKLRKALWGAAAALAGLNIGAFLKGLHGWFGHTQKQIGALQHGYAAPGTVALPRDYPSTRDIAKRGERAAEATWKYLLTHPWALPTTAFAGAVAIAIGRLGGGWIRCGNWSRIGRGVCRTPKHLIDDLMSLLLDFVVLANICQVLPWLEEAASVVAAPMISALTRAGAGLCRGTSGPADALLVPTLHLPTVGGPPTLNLP